MIHTQAFHKGQSQVLRGECKGLLDELREECGKGEPRKHRLLTALPAVLVNSLTVMAIMALCVFGLFAFLISGPLPPEAQDALSNLFAILLAGCVIAGYAVCASYETDLIQLKEVTAYFYERFASKAKEFPDLAMAVDGQEFLTNQEAASALRRLIRRLDQEIVSTGAGKSQDAMRRKFQEVSLRDKSELAP
ncbi:hypothetical protein DV532_26960 (plasmid) [Pseudomonas sp. Leaf58]|uniref:hypothetical protein n=1 Tax=Pseudomonas sp. Leaf58 TaxID=1736226 RepID=UPI00070181BC|nr:hypothetical protein [Pseudomonas sp. Leaf58]AYG47926.1 hypothetical protein DV532_26960 [Pseudomonas sp. Leaf58]KQN62511.1 hypothetical protein ASF02_10210 [Pseudomonas sp. Leaf58]